MCGWSYRPDVRLILPTGCAVDLTRFTLHLQFLALINPPAKEKIEQWMTDWKNLRVQIVKNETSELFEFEIVFINEFLRAGKKWAPIFCDHWVQQKETAKLKPEFYDTTKHYRLTVEKSFNQNRFSNKFFFSANAATFQGQPQSDQNKPEKGFGSSNKLAKKEDWKKKIQK